MNTMRLREFLKTSYTAYQAAENVAAILSENGFVRLDERQGWKLEEGGK